MKEAEARRKLNAHKVKEAYKRLDAYWESVERRVAESSPALEVTLQEAPVLSYRKFKGIWKICFEMESGEWLPYEQWSTIERMNLTDLGDALIRRAEEVAIDFCRRVDDLPTIE